MKRVFLLTFSFLFVLMANSWAQSRTVTGTVTSAEDGIGLPGVAVLVKGTSTGVVTDFNGEYRVTVPSPEAVLSYSFVGFIPQEVVVGTRSTIDIVLEPDVKQLSEVVVVGYGTQLKQDLTGNVANISGEDIESTPVPTFEQALQGRAAGVQISSMNGKVGQGMNIRIRGGSSISASNEPLYVIDGIPVTSQSPPSTSGAPTSPLADINFNDIESIQILKDASAAAIYGSRAANGVVLITTKQGVAGETKFNASVQYGVSRPTGRREFLNAAQYIELFQEAAWNNDVRDGFFADVVNAENPALIPENIENHPDYQYSWLEYMHGTFDYLAGDTDWRALETDTDWNDIAFQDARVQIYDLSAQGGTEKTQFYASGGYSDTDGILIGNRFERIAGRLNLNHELGERFDLGLTVGISKTNNFRVSDDNQFATPLQLVAQAPITPVRDKEGVLFDDSFNPAMFYYPATVELENSSFLTSTYRNLVSANIVYEATDHLSITGEYGFDLLTQNEDRYQDDRTIAGRSVNGYGSASWTRIFNATSRVFATYANSFDIHNVDLTGGVEFQSSEMDYSYVAGQGYPVEDLQKVASAAEIVAGETSLTEFTFLSYFARANYKLQDRYLFSISGRVDGSSRFGTENRYGFFPAASAGWIISNEGFMDNDAISFLKLRASYGVVGNAEIGNFEHLGLYVAEPYGGVSGLRPSQFRNPGLGWETTAQFDVGVDFGFFNDRLTGEVDYYQKNTTDLLLRVPLPATTGYEDQTRNLGALTNQGFELALDYHIVTGSDFHWSAGLNLARNINEITDLGDQDIIDNGSSSYLNVVKVGEPIGVFYGPEYAGVNPANGDAIWFVNGEATADGEAIFEQNGRLVTNNYNFANKVVLGNPSPEFFGGLSNSLSYKGLELNVLLQGVYGNKIFNGGGTYMSANARYEDNQTIDQLARWQKPGDITDVPQARLYSNNGAQASSRYLSDGSYLRLKSVTIGYNLPADFLNRYEIDRLRIFLSGQNLLTFTGYEGWDPEVNTDYLASNIFLGNDFYAAPQARTVTLGVKFGF
ncbi:SusC/RagA family TonB-linked outer membrane protein [Nafulsella turpanensis]|uniref:SusC/RagA family TonB-linked outer membrane protein n=1 Tax=Nafulsella turpanensis TaxID=1265690 RepID=UPI0003476D29|nr:TonB-dependent receptor [Nafulsella turpanensis]